jgi:hypothetical protein
MANTDAVISNATDNPILKRVNINVDCETRFDLIDPNEAGKLRYKMCKGKSYHL